MPMEEEEEEEGGGGGEEEEEEEEATRQCEYRNNCVLVENLSVTGRQAGLAPKRRQHS